MCVFFVCVGGGAFPYMVLCVGGFGRTVFYMCIEHHIQVDMCHEHHI